MSERPVLFLSDFGYEDEFTGACKAVIERYAPGTRVIDLTHGIPVGDVRRGALALEAAALRAGPAVYLAVIDPMVGGPRRAVALSAGESCFVGPDNGLLLLAAERLGGVDEAVEISASALRLEPLAPTFHGRDLFAPVAAHLASGRPLSVAGDPLDPATLERLALPAAVVEGDVVRAHVLYADRYGNLILDLHPEQLEPLGITLLVEPGGAMGSGAFAGILGPAPEERSSVSTQERLRVRVDGDEHLASVAPSFAWAADGELVLYSDSSGRVGLAVNGGSAAERLRVGRDDELVIEA